MNYGPSSRTAKLAISRAFARISMERISVSATWGNH